MTDPTISTVGRGYLAELERALSGVAAEVRDGIMSGISEELSGLDAEAAAARIRTLGDPEFIAAEARAETHTDSTPDSSPVPNRRKTSAGEPRWFSVLAALLVALGGIVIPVVGWVIGIAMVWMSTTWRRRDKWVVTLLPVAGTMLATLLLFAQIGAADSPSSPANPLVPSPFDSVWSSVIGSALIAVVTGVWLLWRAKPVWAAESVAADARVAAVGHDTTVPSPSRVGWYPVVTVLLLMLGGYIVPLLGWIFGVGMLWASDAWSRREKWVGTLAGPAAIVAFVLVGLALRLGVGMGAGTGNLTWWHRVLMGGVALPFAANVIAGVWLLRRAGSRRA